MSVNFWIGMALQAVGAVAGVSDDKGPSATLRTVEGQSMRGVLVPSSPGTFGLSSADFAEPLSVRPDRVDSILLAAGEDASDRAPALLELVLSDGSRLHARVLERSPDSWHIEAEGLGTHRVANSVVVEETYLGGGEADQDGLIYAGPTGLAGWQQDGKGAPWEARPGRLAAGSASKRITRDFGLGDGRTVRARLKWAGTPRFRILVGGNAKLKASATVTLESWGGSLVAWSTADKRTSYIELARGLENDSEISLSFALSETDTTFFDVSGAEMGRLAHQKVAGPNLGLINDGAALEVGELVIVRGDAGKTGAMSAVPFDAKPSAAVPDGHVRLIYADGRRVSGAFVQVGLEGIEIQPAWAESPWTCSLKGLDSLQMQRSRTSKRKARPSKSFLVASQGEVAGELEAISASGEVIWKPTVSMASATLAPESIERVVINRTTAYYVSSRKFPHLMRLRSGDAFRCAVRSVGDGSVIFDSPFGDRVTVDESLVKAIEFDVRAMKRFAKIFAEKDKPDYGGYMVKDRRRETSAGFDAKSLERALSLPRKYKKRRFEHLVLARNGDFLRTNLLGLTAEGASYPGQGDAPRSVPMGRLAALIWLNPSKVKDAEPSSEGLMVRVILDESTSLSLVLSGSDGGQLRGRSPVLGDLALDLASILSIELEKAAVQSASLYADWVHKPMKEPFPDPEPAPVK